MSDFADELPLAPVPAFTRFLEAGEAVTLPVSAFGSPPPPVRGVTTLFTAPLRVEGRALGTLQGDRDGALTPEQLLLTRGLANHAALALERVRLRSELAAMQSSGAGPGIGRAILGRPVPLHPAGEHRPGKPRCTRHRKGGGTPEERAEE